MPCLFATRARAPAARSACVSSASSFSTAQCSAVDPSASAAFGSPPFASCARAARESPAFTASSSVRDCPASVTAKPRQQCDHESQCCLPGPTQLECTEALRRNPSSSSCLCASVCRRPGRPTLVPSDDSSANHDARQLHAGQRVDRNMSIAVAERVVTNANLVEQRQQQVRHRHLAAEHEVAVPLDAAVATSDDEQRKIRVRVRVGIAQARAVEQQRVIQQRPIAVRRRLQLLEETRRTAPPGTRRPSRTWRSVPADPGDATARGALRSRRSPDRSGNSARARA